MTLLLAPSAAALAARLLADDVLDPDDARRQDIRPLRVALLNLTPRPIETEAAALRLLANTPLQVEATLVRLPEQERDAIAGGHFLRHYAALADLVVRPPDALVAIATDPALMGASRVACWEQFNEVVDWLGEAGLPALFVGWAAEEALARGHGVGRSRLIAPRLGDAVHVVVAPDAAPVRGFAPLFAAPVARFSALDPGRHGPRVLIATEDGAPTLLHDAARRRLYAIDHVHGDSVAPGRRRPGWGAHAHLLVANWLDREVYRPASLPRPA